MYNMVTMVNYNSLDIWKVPKEEILKLFTVKKHLQPCEVISIK